MAITNEQWGNLLRIMDGGEHVATGPEPADRNQGNDNNADERYNLIRLSRFLGVPPHELVAILTARGRDEQGQSH